MIEIFTYAPEGPSESNQACSFANINGKIYQILRSYQKQYKEIWLHVAGATALRQADLGKQWEVRGSKGVYIGYVNRYFHYQSERTDLQLAFIGNSTSGSHFLALWFISQHYHLDFSEKHLFSLSQLDSPCWDSHHFGTSYLEEIASNDPERRAVYVDFQCLDNAATAKELLEEILTEKGDNDD